MAGTIGIDAYPLYWPDGWKRTSPYSRKRSKFKTTFAVARDECIREIGLLIGRHARQPIISTNVSLRRDGLPLAGQRQPEDPGVAVYFMRNNVQQVLACDTYDRIEDNIHAVELTVNALRLIGRHGASTILDRAFQGFKALTAGSRRWQQVLGVGPDWTAEEVEKAYRRALTTTHPDRGGSAEAFDEVQKAWNECKQLA